MSSSLNRCAALAAVLVTAPAAAWSAGQPFSEDWLRARAQQLSRTPYDAHDGVLPRELAELTYDQYRDIRFRPERNVWSGDGTAFQLQLFHLGQIFKQPVGMYVVDQGEARPIEYDPALFDYGKNQFPAPLPRDLGFAGFKAYYPINRPDARDEVIVFLGASYFRALGRGSVYGLSARGLAVDTGLPKGEEFPWFREFYVEKPPRDGRQLVVHALLDGPSTTGAYRFEITPGESTDVRVTATLFPRQRAERLGLAPLTSMFFFGQGGRARFDDFRPAVHDSDGLLLWLGNGERVWRPLQNPERLQVSAFQASSLKGFGLMQRDRQPGDYADPESQFERRPSAWVEPLEGFGNGTVFLVEIPSKEETNDNVVAFFTPARPPEPGTSLRIAYRLSWGNWPAPAVPTAVAVSTRTGSARQVGLADDKQPLPPTARKFVIDFVAPRPPEPPRTGKPARRGRTARRVDPPPPPSLATIPVEQLEAVVSVTSGKVHNARVEAYPAIQGWRVVFDWVPEPGKAADMRAFIKHGEGALSETWTYWVPPPPEEKRS